MTRFLLATLILILSYAAAVASSLTSYQPETIKIIQRVQQACGRVVDPSESDQWDLDIRTLKKYGVVTGPGMVPLVAFHDFSAAADDCAAHVNLANPSLADLTEYGDCISLYTQSLGIQGDAATCYLEGAAWPTGYPSLSQDNADIGMYVLALGDNFNEVIGLAPGSNALACGPGSTTGTRFCRLNTLTTPAGLGNGSTGIMAVDRPDASTVRVYQNGVAIAGSPFASASSTIVGNPALRIFWSNFAPNYADSLVAMVWVAPTQGAAFQANMSSALVEILVARGSVASDNVYAVERASGDNAFTQAMLSDVVPSGLAIVRQGIACPLSDAILATNINTPMTVCQTQDMVRMAGSTATQFKVVHFLWQNRYNPTSSSDPNRGRPPNPIAFPPIFKSTGQRCWLQYTSVTKADAATRAELAYSAGAVQTNGSTGWQDIAIAGGFVSGDIYQHDATHGPGIQNFADNVDTLCTSILNGFPVAVDKVVLTQGRLADVTMPNDGFLLDYEPQEGRTTSVSHLTAVNTIAAAHGYNFSVYTNPLFGNTATYNNLTAATLPAILALSNLKYLSVIITPQSFARENVTQQFTDAATALNGGVMPVVGNSLFGKVSITFQFGTFGTTVADATTIHQIIQTYGIPEVNLFPKGAVFGGACNRRTNYLLAALLGLPC